MNEECTVMVSMSHHAGTSDASSGSRGSRRARPDVEDLIVRRLHELDSIEELTALLHRAYRAQVQMGLAPLAGRQTPDVTRTRVASGECYVAVLGADLGARLDDRRGAASRNSIGGGGEERKAGKIVGTILFEEKEDAAIPAWFTRPEVAHYSLFGVDPHCQGRGVGLLLLDAVERRARELGFAHLALSMAEPDTGLMRFYLKRGYGFVEHWQWPYTNYRSCILSKPLGGAGSASS